MFLFLNRSFTASSIHSPQTHVPSPPSLSLSPSLFLSIHPGRRCGSRGLRPTRQQPASAINFRAPTPSNISLPFVYAPVPLFAGGPRYTRINALRITVKRREKNPPPPPPRSISICEMALATGASPLLPSFVSLSRGTAKDLPPSISNLSSSSAVDRQNLEDRHEKVRFEKGVKERARCDPSLFDIFNTSTPEMKSGAFF